MNMHASETLRSDVFGKQPNHYDLDFTKKLEKMLSQYSVDPLVSEAIAQSRIPSLLTESVRLANGTAQELAGLRAELIVTNGIATYYVQPCAKLEESNRTKVAALLSYDEEGASNDSSFQMAA